jgi:hypothetical protein
MSNSIESGFEIYMMASPFICGNNNKTNYGPDFSGSIEALAIKMLAEVLTTKVVAEPIVVKSKWQQNKQQKKKKLH